MTFLIATCTLVAAELSEVETLKWRHGGRKRAVGRETHRCLRSENRSNGLHCCAWYSRDARDDGGSRRTTSKYPTTGQALLPGRSRRLVQSLESRVLETPRKHSEFGKAKRSTERRTSANAERRRCAQAKQQGKRLCCLFLLAKRSSSFSSNDDVGRTLVTSNVALPQRPKNLPMRVTAQECNDATKYGPVLRAFPPS